MVSHSSIHQNKISGLSEKTKGLTKRRNCSPWKKDQPFHLLTVAKAPTIHLQDCWLHILWNIKWCQGHYCWHLFSSFLKIPGTAEARTNQHSLKQLLGEGWKLPRARDCSQETFCIWVSCLGRSRQLSSTDTGCIVPVDLSAREWSRMHIIYEHGHSQWCEPSRYMVPGLKCLSASCQFPFL